MIGPALTNIMVNPYNNLCSLCKTIGPNERLLEATTIPKRDEKRFRVVARTRVDRIFCGREGLPELVCAS